MVAILCGCSFAQDQDSSDAYAEFGRLCQFSGLSTPYNVGTDFSVKISFRHAPLPGIRVVLDPSGESADASGRSRVPVTAVTDSSGTAKFIAVAPGEYTAEAKDGLFFPSNEVTVHPDGAFRNEIEIEWPWGVLPVRTLRGKLIVPGEGTEPDSPLQSATVQLVDLRSSRVIETQSTIDDGSYEFSTTEPGLYAVRLIPPTKDRKTEPTSGDHAVELDPAALESTIPDLKVLQSACFGVQVL